MKNQNFTQKEQELLRETFKAISDHCKATGNNDEKNHRKELNRLINLNLRWGETLHKAVDDSYWSVIEGIDTENQLALENS